jgi:predicted RNA-binding Zn ribbon-like protein
LRKVSPQHQIVRGVSGFTWTWDTDISRPEYLLGPVLLDAADLLTSGKFAKIRQCSDEACGWLFLDRSQAGKRRWCSMADCGNRYKARRYYRRQQAG